MSTHSKALMKLMVVALALSSAAFASQAYEAPALEKNLVFLEPLMANNWTGGFVGEDAPDLEIVLHFEPMVQGKAVRYTRVAEGANYYAEMFFFWDPGEEAVRFLRFDNKGNVARGTVKVEDTRFVLHGTGVRPDKHVNFENVFEMLPDGRLRDTYTPLNMGSNARGHVQEYEPIKQKDESEDG